MSLARHLPFKADPLQRKAGIPLREPTVVWICGLGLAMEPVSVSARTVVTGGGLDNRLWLPDVMAIGDKQFITLAKSNQELSRFISSARDQMKCMGFIDELRQMRNSRCSKDPTVAEQLFEDEDKSLPLRRDGGETVTLELPTFEFNGEVMNGLGMTLVWPRRKDECIKMQLTKENLQYLRAACLAAQMDPNGAKKRARVDDGQPNGVYWYDQDRYWYVRPKLDNGVRRFKSFKIATDPEDPEYEAEKAQTELVARRWLDGRMWLHESAQAV